MNPKIIISIVVTFSLLTSPLILRASEFSDVSSTYKNSNAIDYLQEAGVINGYSDGTFKPENSVNRAELLKILIEGKGINTDESKHKNCFSDVTEEWFAKYICYAKEQGWVSGYADGTFKPAQTVNKVEVIKMLVNSQGYEIPESVTAFMFADIDNLAWYASYVWVAKNKGLLEEEDWFYPEEGMKRSGISENIYRTIIVEKNSLKSFSEYTPEKDTFYNVAEVVDGDTIKINIDGKIETLRLIGIDTPESVHPTKPVECFGKEASDKAKEILEGKRVRLENDPTQGERDKYNRLLRYIFLEDGMNFNKLMISEGYAFEYTYGIAYKYQKEFKDAEKEAQENKKGLWSTETCNGESDLNESDSQDDQENNETETKDCSTPPYHGNYDENCVLFCDDGWEPENNQCVLDCKEGEHEEYSMCQPNVKDCYIYSGEGQQKWDGEAWGECKVTSCRSGYKQVGNTCEIETTSGGNGGGSYFCGSKDTCGEMDSCSEAYYYLNTCGVGSLDRDKDGIPCESLCD